MTGPFMDDARHIAAQCWCDDETKDTVMDSVLAEAFAKRLASWMETAAEFSRNMEFHRNLLIEIGEKLGPDVYVSDDGSIQDSPLLLKIPAMIDHLLDNQNW